MIGNWLRGRRAAWLKTGAALDETKLRSVRLMRWWAPLGGAICLTIAATDDRPRTILLFGGVGLVALFFLTPACFTFLEGHRRREEIDVQDAEPFIPARRLIVIAILVSAAFVLAVPVIEWFRVHSAG